MLKGEAVDLDAAEGEVSRVRGRVVEEKGDVMMLGCELTIPGVQPLADIDIDIDLASFHRRSVIVLHNSIHNRCLGATVISLSSTKLSCQTT